MKKRIRVKKVKKMMFLYLFLCMMSLHIWEGQACSYSNESICSRYPETEIFNSTNIQDISAGSCLFRNTFCNYTQGCIDAPASKWKLNDDFASIDGVSGCFYSRSVLKSPFLCITDVACLQFHVTTRSDLFDVFLAYAGGSVTTVLEADVSGNEKNISHTVSLQSGLLTILFRGMNGGSDRSNTIRLKSVSIVLGNCSNPACNFTDQALCGWDRRNWEMATANNSGKTDSFAQINPSQKWGELTTILTRATYPAMKCLNFSYLVRGNSNLTVFILLQNNTKLFLWNISEESSTSNWENKSLEVYTRMAYKIVFEGSGYDNNSVVAIDNVRTEDCPCLSNYATANYSSQSTNIHNIECSWNDSSVWMETYQSFTSLNYTPQCQFTFSIPTSSSSKSTPKTKSSTDSYNTSEYQFTSSTSASSSSKSTPTTKSSSYHYNTSESYLDVSAPQTKNTSVRIGAIVGPIMAVIAIIAVVIVIVAWRRRRRNVHNGNKDKINKGPYQQPTAVEADISNVNSQFDVTNNVESTTQDETVLTNISGKRSTPPYTPIHVEPHATYVYDLIPEDGYSGNSHCHQSDNLIKHADTNEFNMHSLKGENGTNKLNRTNLTEKQTGASVYSVAQNIIHTPEIIDEIVNDYNRIHFGNSLSGKELRSETLNEYNKLQSTARAPICSVTQNSRHTPEITDEIVNEYNRIDREKRKYGKETEGTNVNVYNKLKSHVYGIAPSYKNDSFEPAMDTPQDDYNKLDYKQNQYDRSADDKRNENRDDCDPTLNVYTSVGNLNDAYARVDIEKKGKIIASDYDHIV